MTCIMVDQFCMSKSHAILGLKGIKDTSYIVYFRFIFVHMNTIANRLLLGFLFVCYCYLDREGYDWRDGSEDKAITIQA